MAVKKVIVISAETKTAQKNINELNETLEFVDEIIKNLNNDLAEQQRLLENTSKTDLKARKKINEAIQKTKKEIAAEKKGRALLNEEKKQGNKVLKESIKDQKDLTGVMGYLDKVTGGAVSGMQGFISGITGATKGMKLFKVALIASGIGLLVIALTSIVAAFKRSEEGQEKFQIALAAIGASYRQGFKSRKSRSR